MLAVLQDGPGEPSVLRLGEAARPQLGDHQLLVRVEAAGVNRADTLQRRGRYPAPPGVTDILGLECAGRVAEVGAAAVGDFAVGEAVMALLPGGGYAEFVAVHAGHVMRSPPALAAQPQLAAAVPEVWLTAYQLLHSTAALRPGHTVLVHAGASGVGTAAVQLITLAGASAFVTAGSDAKVEAAVKLGAAGGCNYKTGSWREAVARWTGGRGVDIILDCIGGSYFQDNLASLALDGVWVLYGLLGGAEVSGPVLAALLRRRGSLRATTLRARSDEYKAQLVAGFSRDILPHFSGAAPRLVPVVDTVLGIRDMVTAHTRMEHNQNIGKIIMTFDNLKN